ncbi:hypothetical protein N665_0209s0006 [Sinapis alba]|nr:hypothetical protein N665_0209s0006 [Sinapis alba]
MASDSQTTTATTSEKPLENKVNEEAKLMEKEIVFQETVDVVKDKPVSDSSLTVTKVENINQTPADEPEKEPHADVEEVAVVVKAEDSTEKGTEENGEKKVAERVELKEPSLVKEEGAEAADAEKAEGKGKDENGEEKVSEQVELKEPTPVKQSGEVADAEKAEGIGKDENGEEKVAEQVERKEPILVKEGAEEVKVETVDVEKAEEKGTVESVPEEDNNDKEETKVVDVSESTDEAGGVQLVREVPEETVKDKIKDVEVLEVAPKPNASEKVETQPEKANESATDVEVVKTEEAAKVELEGKLEDTNVVETKDSGINSKDEQTSESVAAPQKETEGDASSPADVIEKAITEEKHVVDEPSKDEKASESVSVLCPEKVDPDRNLEHKTEGDASFSPAEVIEKAITKEKHVVEESSKDEQENVTEAKDVATKVATEEENIKKVDETPAADVKSEETLKETEGNKQEESVPEKVAEVVETEPVVKEIEEPEVTTKEAVVVKPKNSNSIMSKVKKSLVKAKKAIIGKSPSSKTISTQEAKEEIKAK